jgi:hypothetical protein
MVDGELIEMTPEEIAELEASLGPPPNEQPQPEPKEEKPDARSRT